MQCLGILRDPHDERQPETCGTVYPDRSAPFATIPQCPCGTYAIGACSTCGVQVCGHHSALLEDRRQCGTHYEERRLGILQEQARAIAAQGEGRHSQPSDSNLLGAYAKEVEQSSKARINAEERAALARRRETDFVRRLDRDVRTFLSQAKRCGFPGSVKTGGLAVDGRRAVRTYYAGVGWVLNADGSWGYSQNHEDGPWVSVSVDPNGDIQHLANLSYELGDGPSGDQSRYESFLRDLAALAVKVGVRLS